jgi:exonuclease III
MKIASFNINNINRRFTKLASAMGGVGYKLPQEARQAFAQAIVDVADVWSPLACIGIFT